jgi:hypothetical protein
VSDPNCGDVLGHGVKSPDPFDLLSEINPVDLEDLAGLVSSAAAHDALERIVGERPDRDSDRSRRPRRLRQRPVLPRSPMQRALIFAAIPIAGLGFAFAASQYQTRSSSITVSCYSGASLKTPAITVHVRAGSPISVCGRELRAVEGGSPTSRPRLHACLLPDNSVGVVPSPDFRICQELGLRPLRTEPRRG